MIATIIGTFLILLWLGVVIFRIVRQKKEEKKTGVHFCTGCPQASRCKNCGSVEKKEE